MEYKTDGFIEKNGDSTSDSLINMARTSGVALVQTLFARESDSESGVRGTPRGSATRKSAGAKSKTIGTQFSSQLNSLMASLNATSPHFIRCVKANHAKKPHQFDGTLCLDQLKYAGLFEAIRIRKAGYSYRIPHDNFCRRFAITVKNLVKLYAHGKMDDISVAKRICENATEQGYLSRKSWEVGKTKIFLKDNSDKVSLEELRESKCDSLAVAIQSILRMHLVRKRVFAEKVSSQSLSTISDTTSHSWLRSSLFPLRTSQFEQQKRLARIKMENEKNGAAAIKCQTAFRAHYVKKRSRDLKLIVQLKLAMNTGEQDKIQEAVNEFKGVKLTAMAERAIYEAKTYIREMRDRGRVLYKIEVALAREAVDDLEDLVEEAYTLGMEEEGSVRMANEMVSTLREKKATHRKLNEFLEDDTQNSDNIQELIDRAKALGVNDVFVKKVEMVYRDVAPKLEVRQILRSGVEHIDYQKIEEGLKMMDEMIKVMEGEYMRGERSASYKDFCVVERAAAKKIKKMLLLEQELMTRSQDDIIEDLRTDDDDIDPIYTIKDSNARLTSDLIRKCVDIEQAITPQVKKNQKQELKASLESVEEYNKIIRSYKWGKIFATWKYQTDDEDKLPDEDESFFGLNPMDAFKRSLYGNSKVLEELGGGRSEEEKKEEEECETARRRGLKKVPESSTSLMQTPKKALYYGAGVKYAAPERDSGRKTRTKAALDMGGGATTSVSGYELRRAANVSLSDLEK